MFKLGDKVIICKATDCNEAFNQHTIDGKKLWVGKTGFIYLIEDFSYRNDCNCNIAIKYDDRCTGWWWSSDEIILFNENKRLKIN